MQFRQPAYDALLQSPIGPIGIAADERGQLFRIDLNASPRIPVAGNRPGRTVEAVLDWLSAYFRDSSTPTLRLSDPHGTPHQLRVWSALRRIPPGRVRRYGDLARSLHSSPRAIGQACRSNPLPLLIPCHRIVSTSGLGGFMGHEHALAIKQWLLAHEGAL